MENIQMIRIERLHPHPDNPRKNLGDLTELTASIKASGIFQNLTVVPGHVQTLEEWRAICKAEGVSRDNADGTYSAEWCMEGYTVIIGHRRLAAATAAGLTELPCAVVEMTEEEQLQTMLTENMQRSDLTIVEQAEGMQMVLDLGISVADLSKQTGFSESTIRRRVKLLKLDRKELEAAEGRGGTIKDYMELDKIKDEKRKLEVLKTIGTSDFNWKLKSAINEEETLEKIQDIETQLQEFATLILEEQTKDKNIITTLYRYRTDFQVPEDTDERKYYYTVQARGTINMMLRLYTDKTEYESEDEDYSEDPEEYKWLDEMEEADAEEAGTFFELRKQFVSEIPERKIGAHIDSVIKQFLKNERAMVNDDIYEMMEIKMDDLGWTKKPNAEDLNKYIEEHPARALLLYTWGKTDEYRKTIDWDETSDGRKYIITQDKRRIDRLEAMYGLLREFGYDMSIKEMQYLNGAKLEMIQEDFDDAFPGKRVEEEDDE